jgi:hypothetical protein
MVVKNKSKEESLVDESVEGSFWENKKNASSGRKNAVVNIPVDELGQ